MERERGGGRGGMDRLIGGFFLSLFFSYFTFVFVVVVVVVFKTKKVCKKRTKKIKLDCLNNPLPIHSPPYYYFPFSKVMQPLPNQIYLVPDPLPPAAKGHPDTVYAKHQKPDCQHGRIAVSIDSLVECGVCSQEGGFVGHPAKCEWCHQCKRHENRRGKDEASSRQANIWVEPSVPDDASKSICRPGR